MWHHLVWNASMQHVLMINRDQPIKVPQNELSNASQQYLE